MGKINWRTDKEGLKYWRRVLVRVNYKELPNALKPTIYLAYIDQEYGKFYLDHPDIGGEYEEVPYTVIGWAPIICNACADDDNSVADEVDDAEQNPIRKELEKIGRYIVQNAEIIGNYLKDSETNIEIISKIGWEENMCHKPMEGYYTLKNIFSTVTIKKDTTIQL